MVHQSAEARLYFIIILFAGKKISILLLDYDNLFKEMKFLLFNSLCIVLCSLNVEYIGLEHGICQLLWNSTTGLLEINSCWHV